jgi:hypothetical protein
MGAGRELSRSLGMEQLGQELDAVDDPRAGTREEGVGIDRHDPAEPWHLGPLKE